MVKIRKYANGIERFLHGQKGQRFFNFAYSIGAAIVIWGALFKILHLPGGSTLLCIGMGTEIAMFILTAFDRPPKEYAWEEVFPALTRTILKTALTSQAAEARRLSTAEPRQSPEAARHLPTCTRRPGCLPEWPCRKKTPSRCAQAYRK